MHPPAPPSTDHDLLHRYLKSSDQSAFTQLAARHIHALYAAANRQVRDNQPLDPTLFHLDFPPGISVSDPASSQPATRP